MPNQKQPDPKSQPGRLNFEELARKLGVDEDEKAFEKTVRRLAKKAPAKPGDRE